MSDIDKTLILGLIVQPHIGNQKINGNAKAHQPRSHEEKTEEMRDSPGDQRVRLAGGNGKRKNKIAGKKGGFNFRQF